MEFSNFKFSKKHNNFRTLINVYNFNKDNFDVYLRSDYKIIVSDDKIEEIINIPERIKIKEITCHYVTDSIIMIEIILKDLDFEIKWK